MGERSLPDDPTSAPPLMPHLIFFISPHGYGHAARPVPDRLHQGFQLLMVVEIRLEYFG